MNEWIHTDTDTKSISDYLPHIPSCQINHTPRRSQHTIVWWEPSNILPMHSLPPTYTSSTFRPPSEQIYPLCRRNSWYKFWTALLDSAHKFTPPGSPLPVHPILAGFLFDPSILTWFGRSKWFGPIFTNRGWHWCQCRCWRGFFSSRCCSRYGITRCGSMRWRRAASSTRSGSTFK